jgi:hypothetical protein
MSDGTGFTAEPAVEGMIDTAGPNEDGTTDTWMSKKGPKNKPSDGIIWVRCPKDKNTQATLVTNVSVSGAISSQTFKISHDDQDKIIKLMKALDLPKSK